MARGRWARHFDRSGDPVLGDPRLLGDDAAFAAVVREVCGVMGCTVESFSGDRIRLFGRITGLVGLEEVRRACLPLPRGQWRSVVEAHLTGLADSLEASVPLGDPDAAGPLLRTRLANPARLPPGCLSRLLADGLAEVLVARVGQGVATVPADAPVRWDVPVAELFERGRRQVLAEGLLDRQTVDLGGVSALVLQSPSVFTATHVLWLPTYLDLAPAGALVAMPAQTLVMAHALRDDTALDAVQALLMNAARLHATEPRSLSSGVYWWRPDSPLIPLPAEVSAERISFYPPAEFVDVVRQLPPAA